MKTPEQVIIDIERRLKNTWNTHLNHTMAVDPAWPHTFPLGAVTKADLERNFDKYRTESLTLRAWATQHGVDLTDAGRLVMGTTQRIPTTSQCPTSTPPPDYVDPPGQHGWPAVVPASRPSALISSTAT